MRVLIIDDERAMREVLQEHLAKEKFEAVAVGTGNEALEILEKDSFDVAVVDLRLPDIDGIEIITRRREAGDETPFLLITAYASVRTAVNALKAGAADYLIKPIRIPDLVHRIRQLYDLERLRRENTLLKRMVQQDSGTTWVPDTPAGQQISEMMSKVADTDMTVVITGESGTGKGMMARMLHKISKRTDRAFVPVNCAAIPETLMESELFGHVKGAFTGTNKSQDGLFVAATGGTLFLDEIGELPLPMQTKLLHAIEEKTIRPVGATHGRNIDARIIVAANQDLEQMVADETFRKDLYFRLNMFQIALPPLREQKEVLTSAVEFFLTKCAGYYKRSEIKIDGEVWQALYDHDWPGNMRELENVIERAVLLSEDGHITLKELPAAIVGQNEEVPLVAPKFGGLKE